MIGWRFATILGFVALFALALLLMAITRRSSTRVATFGEALTQLGGNRGLRAIFIFVWAWVGWHFLAR